MSFLSVNVNKVATLRNSRGKNTPDLLEITSKILRLGVKGITIHPRPDERHIKRSDVIQLKQLLEETPEVEFNIEGYPTPDFIQLIEKINPTQCTLVPDPPETLTSDAGWDIKNEVSFLKPLVEQLRQLKVRSALFIDPMTFDEQHLAALLEVNPDRVELYTEAYADAFETSQKEEITNRYARWANKIHQNKIEINAGHDLNQRNLSYFLEHVEVVREVSIGHAIFCEAIEEGLEKTITSYLKICEQSL